MDDLTSILFDDELSEDQVRNYLDGKLSGEALLAVEKMISESEFSREAIEGLKNISSPKRLDNMVQQLNENMHAHLSKTKIRRKKRKLPNLYLAFLAILIIIAVCFLGYWLIYMKTH